MAIDLSGLEAIVESAIAEIRVNDIPVAIVGRPSGYGQAFVPVPAYLVRGTNRLRAKLSLLGQGPAKVVIRIASFQDGDMFFENRGQELVRLEWDGSVAPTHEERDFAVTFGPERWSWSDCQVWPDAVTALDDAMPFVVALTQAYYTSDALWLERASGAKFRDLALAFSNIPEAQQRAQIAAVIAESAPEPVPVSDQPLGELCCNGRLLLLLDNSGDPWLRKRLTLGSGLEVLLGKYRGEWQLIR